MLFIYYVFLGHLLSCCSNLFAILVTHISYLLLTLIRSYNTIFTPLEFLSFYLFIRLFGANVVIMPAIH